MLDLLSISYMYLALSSSFPPPSLPPLFLQNKINSLSFFPYLPFSFHFSHDQLVYLTTNEPLGMWRREEAREDGLNYCSFCYSGGSRGDPGVRTNPPFGPYLIIIHKILVLQSY